MYYYYYVFSVYAVLVNDMGDGLTCVLEKLQNISV